MGSIHRLGRRLVRAIRVSRSREALERDMDEEMRIHVEMEAEELMRTQGLSPSEARRQALITFGGMERYQEEARAIRGLPALEELWRDVRHAARRLRREPGFSVPAVASVVLGIGVAVAVFALVNAALLRPLPYPDPDRLVALTHSASDGTLSGEGLSFGTFFHYREHGTVFEEIGLYLERDRALTDAEGAAVQVRAADVSAGLLSLLGARPHLGRLLTPEDAVPGTRSGVVISHALWVRRYGAEPDIIGREIEVERVRREVMGVMEPGFGFPHPETHVWYSSWIPESVSDIGQFYWNAVARLQPGVTHDRAEADLARLVRSLPDAYPDFTPERLEELGLRAQMTPLKEHVLGDAAPALRLLLGMAVFLLFITWANAANLCLARGERQRLQIAVAQALGARAGHVARRFFVEGLLLAGLGAAFSLPFVYAAVAFRFGFDLDGIPRLREVAMDGAVIALVLILALPTATLLGGVSYLSARRADVAGALTGVLGRLTAGGREQLGRRVLVAAQLALALTLLVGAALMAGSFWRLTRVQLGFEPAGAITFRLPTPANAYESTNHYHAQVRLHDQVLRNIRAIPGVQAAEAANTSGFPLTPVPSFYWTPIADAGRAATGEESWPDALFGFATPGYFDAIGIPIVQGRSFLPEDTGRDGHGVVLSRSLARALFGTDDPIGRRVRWGTPSSDPDYVVVGVVGDVSSETIRDGPSPVLYFPNLHPPAADTITGVVHIFIPSDEMYVVRTSLPPASVVPAIREAVSNVDPKLIMTRAGTLDGLVADSRAQTRLTLVLLIVGATTALFLGVIGIYGVLSYTVGRRTPELGIRIALGASPARVIALVVRQGALVALAGIAAGLLAAFALTRFLDSLLYEVSPSEPTAFVAMALLLFLVALAASFVPARRAARIDPTSALKAN